MKFWWSTRWKLHQLAVNVCLIVEISKQTEKQYESTKFAVLFGCISVQFHRTDYYPTRCLPSLVCTWQQLWHWMLLPTKFFLRSQMCFKLPITSSWFLYDLQPHTHTHTPSVTKWPSHLILNLHWCNYHLHSSHSFLSTQWRSQAGAHWGTCPSN